MHSSRIGDDVARSVASGSDHEPRRKRGCAEVRRNLLRGAGLEFRMKTRRRASWESIVRLTCDSTAWQKSDGSPANRAWLRALCGRAEVRRNLLRCAGLEFRMKRRGSVKGALFGNAQYVSPVIPPHGRRATGHLPTGCGRGISVDVQKFQEISFDGRAWSSERRDAGASKARDLA
jgi:hypothetical protein